MATQAPKPTVVDPVTDDADDFPPFPPVGPLRLKLAALGVDGSAPDFGEKLCLLSRDNERYEFEYSAKGELIILPPVGAEGSHGEQAINYALFGWGSENPGRTYSQTSLFRLPSGAQYMPDAAWISRERFENLTALEQRGSINGAPDFLIELHSRSGNLRAGLAKMWEWMDAGARMGWYIQPYQRRVYVYRAGRDVEILESPETLSGEELLPGFVLEVRRLVFDRYE
jgi:Uma2 family endonuclease